MLTLQILTNNSVFVNKETGKVHNKCEEFVHECRWSLDVYGLKPRKSLIRFHWSLVIEDGIDSRVDCRSRHKDLIFQGIKTCTY